jgi:hypothetical protein
MRARIGLALMALALGCGSGPSPSTHTVDPAPPRRTQCTVALRMEDDTAGETEPSDIAIPHTRVTLVRICEPGGTETRVIGSEAGICQFADPAEALIRVRCWWAGDGSELELHRVLRQIVVRRAVLEDEVLGPFSDAVELDLPVGAQLNVLGPDTLPRHP